MTDYKAKIEELKREYTSAGANPLFAAIVVRKMFTLAESLLAELTAIRGARDEEVNGRAGDIRNWTDTLLKKYVWQQLDIEGQVMVKDIASFAKEVAEFAISRGRERDAALRQVKELKEENALLRGELDPKKTPGTILVASNTKEPRNERG